MKHKRCQHLSRMFHYRWKCIADGRYQIEERCQECNGFIRWAPQKEPFLTMAGPRPEEEDETDRWLRIAEEEHRGES